jgi:hypothetical protein
MAAASPFSQHRQSDRRKLMKRLCFLTPDIDSAHRVVDDLRQREFKDEDIYVVAREGTPLGDLPDAGAIAESDFYPQLERGLATGGAIGVIGGLIAMRVAGAVFGGAAVLLFGLIGAGVNGLLAAAFGAGFPNSRLTEFEDRIEAGQVLIMVDVPKERVSEVNEQIKRMHPEAEIEGFEPPVPIMPKK